MTQAEKARAFDEFVNKVDKMREIQKENAEYEWIKDGPTQENLEDEVDTMIQFYKDNIKHDTTASTSTQQ